MNPEPRIPAKTTESKPCGPRHVPPEAGGRPQAAAPHGAKPGVLGTFGLGVRVWAREMLRIAAGQVRRHEMRQIAKRLDEEEGLLKGLGTAPGPEAGLCRAEISLLGAELGRLRAEAARRRPGGAGLRPDKHRPNAPQSPREKNMPRKNLQPPKGHLKSGEAADEAADEAAGKAAVKSRPGK